MPTVEVYNCTIVYTILKSIQIEFICFTCSKVAQPSVGLRKNLGQTPQDFQLEIAACAQEIRDTKVHCSGKKKKFCYRVAISKPSCALRLSRMVNIFREAVFGTRLKMRMSLRATITLPAGVMSTWKGRLTFWPPKMLASWNSGVPKHGSFSTSFTGVQPVSTPRLKVEIQIIEYFIQRRSDLPEREILPVRASAGLSFS